MSSPNKHQTGTNPDNTHAYGFQAPNTNGQYYNWNTQPNTVTAPTTATSAPQLPAYSPQAPTYPPSQANYPPGQPQGSTYPTYPPPNYNSAAGTGQQQVPPTVIISNPTINRSRVLRRIIYIRIGLFVVSFILTAVACGIYFSVRT